MKSLNFVVINIGTSRLVLIHNLNGEDTAQSIIGHKNIHKELKSKTNLNT